MTEEVWTRFENTWGGRDRARPSGWVHKCGRCGKSFPRMYTNGTAVRCVHEDIPEGMVLVASCRDDLKNHKRRLRRLPPPPEEIDATLIQIYGLSYMAREWQSEYESMLDV